ncbi:hypothetical protein FZC79_16025 [Rossellomorea vietnamensis]|uniref:Uncharacterized protein n=1 Tax=Rossellomorea vietnamensis TaxID=218284 RepID=A0A5D4KAC7_9BACI|nr:hypothetical protein [Rossellomorea vietnamensis]TYR73966.1 hypothetical protein FZC79_16025 [Rossellomorea vietnamensis]
MKNKGYIVLTGLLLFALVYAGFQFTENQKMGKYLNKQLNERLEMLNLKVNTLHLVTSGALEDKEISKESLLEIQESLEMIRMKSLQVENLARGLNLDNADQLHSITHNTARYMENRIALLTSEIGDRENLSLEGDSIRIIRHIKDTSGKWESETESFLSSKNNINKTDWINSLIMMQNHSNDYQRVMDE